VNVSVPLSGSRRQERELERQPHKETAGIAERLRLRKTQLPEASRSPSVGRGRPSVHANVNPQQEWDH
jgi:hypothetical protein